MNILSRQPAVLPDSLKPLLDRQQALAHWFRRIGVAGFCFFLAKGLFWLMAIGLMYLGNR